ncbi:hypothetical protein D9M73_242030 [compost metagenome]
MSCGAEVELSLAKYLDEGDVALRKEFAEQNIEIYEFSEEERGAIDALLDKASQDYIDRVAERGLPAQQVFDSLRQPTTN